MFSIQCSLVESANLLLRQYRVVARDTKEVLLLIYGFVQHAPKMCPFLMDLFVERERKAALVQIFRA